MSDKLEFVNDNHYNLFAFATLNQLAVSPASKFEVEHQEYRDRYKVSLGGYSWLVKAEFIGKFWLALEKFDAETDGFIDHGNGCANENVKMVATGPVNELTYTYTDVPFGQLTGEDFINIDDRMQGLLTAAAQVVRESAEIINREQALVMKDANVVKDFDGILTFDTKLGKDFGVHLCFDKVSPIKDGNDDVWIERTPITQADGDTYLRGSFPKVQGRLKHLNGIVQDFFQTKAVQKNEYLIEYAEMLINNTLVHMYLNQNIIYFSFGGEDKWGTFSKDTPNNVECMKYLDAEIENIIKMLDGIEKTEGVDIYSMDIDTFAVFGRDFDNRVVTPALQGYVQPLLDKYSKGFEQTLSTRMSMIDNQHFFKA